jgi:tetratricopeptide (TPR) repeat protein
MTQPMLSQSKSRRRLALCVTASLALGGCEVTSLGSRSAVPESQQALSATSPTNIASLTDVVQRNPNDPQAYNMRGTVYGQAGRYPEALADFIKATSLDPNYAQAYAIRGLIHRLTRKFDLALADSNRALSIDPSYAAAYLGRGMVYREQRQ